MVMSDARRLRLSELVARFGGEVRGEDVEVGGVASMESAGPDEIVFVARERFLRQLAASRAGAAIVSSGAADATALPRIVCDDPYLYFARVSALFNPPPPRVPGIHPAAIVESGAQIAPSASIGPLAHIAAGAVIGERSTVETGCVVGEGVVIGDDCHLYPRVVIYHHCILGNGVIVHAGAVIGADGFGLASTPDGRWEKIPQIGRVRIGNDVEIGANTTVDRGALDDTVIEEGVKLDNLVQIGHNCHVGAFTAIAGCVGIAGSTRIGRHCLFGGAAMVGGHIEITDHVRISAATGVGKSIHKPGTYTSIHPIEPHEQWLRNAPHLRRLDQLVNRVKRLEQALQEKEDEQQQ